MSENSIKLAFWINVYNSLIMHVMLHILPWLKKFMFYAFFNLINLCVIHFQAYLAYGIPNSSLKRMALFHKVRRFPNPYVDLWLATATNPEMFWSALTHSAVNSLSLFSVDVSNK